MVFISLVFKNHIIYMWQRSGRHGQPTPALIAVGKIIRWREGAHLNISVSVRELPGQEGGGPGGCYHSDTFPPGRMMEGEKPWLWESVGAKQTHAEERTHH